MSEDGEIELADANGNTAWARQVGWVWPDAHFPGLGIVHFLPGEDGDYPPVRDGIRPVYTLDWDE